MRIKKPDTEVGLNKVVLEAFQIWIEAEPEVLEDALYGSSYCPVALSSGYHILWKSGLKRSTCFLGS